LPPSSPAPFFSDLGYRDEEEEVENIMEDEVDEEEDDDGIDLFGSDMEK
jgi:hypothetical protein